MHLPGSSRPRPAPGELTQIHHVRRLHRRHRQSPYRYGPGQRFAIAAMKVCPRILAKDNEVTVHWVPAHRQIDGGEKADGHAKNRSRRERRATALPVSTGGEASLSYMARAAAEARSRATAEWISSHVQAGRRYRPPLGRGLRREVLRRTRKSLTNRYYQLLSEYAAIGTYVRDKIKGADTGGYWWCSSGEPPLRQVPGVGPLDQEAVEGHREGVRVEALKGPLGQVVVGWEDNGGSLGFLAGYQGRAHGDDRTPEGEGKGQRGRGRGGQAGPSLGCIFVYFLPSFRSFCLFPFVSFLIVKL